MSELHSAIGRHDEAIDNLKEEVKAMRKDLQEIKDLLSQTKGGIRMLITVGSIGGAVGAALVKLLAYVKGV